MQNEEHLTNLLAVYVAGKTDELERAKRLVLQDAKRQREIKDKMKKMGILEFDIDTPTVVGKIKFKIRTSEQIDVKQLPDDIREKYTIIREAWYEELNWMVRPEWAGNPQ